MAIDFKSSIIDPLEHYSIILMIKLLHLFSEFFNVKFLFIYRTLLIIYLCDSIIPQLLFSPYLILLIMLIFVVATIIKFHFIFSIFISIYLIIIVNLDLWPLTFNLFYCFILVFFQLNSVTPRYFVQKFLLLNQ